MKCLPPKWIHNSWNDKKIYFINVNMANVSIMKNWHCEVDAATGIIITTSPSAAAVVAATSSSSSSPSCKWISQHDQHIHVFNRHFGRFVFVVVVAGFVVCFFFILEIFYRSRWRNQIYHPLIRTHPVQNVN